MRRSFAFHIALFVAAVVYGQSASSTTGKDFWLTFGDNAGQSHANISLQIYIVATEKTEGYIRYNNNKTGDKVPVFIEANSFYQFTLLTDKEREDAYSNVTGKSKRSIHIETDEDVSVYAVNISSASADVTMILPSDALSNSYYHLSYRSTSRDGYTIVAIEDNTIIYENGTVIDVLNQGEVYSSYFPSDESGKLVTSNKPFACFTTNACANVPTEAGDCDCLYEQLHPKLWWGRHFFVPVTIRGKERVRITAMQDNTLVYTDGMFVSGSPILNAGQWAEIEIDAAQNGCYIKTTHPVGVASYLAGEYYSALVYSKGAPSMAWIPPIEQYIDEILLVPFDLENSSAFSEHHLIIVAATSAKDQTEMNENGVYTPLSGGTWHDHPSGYSYYTLPFKKKTGIKNPEGMLVYAYGLGDAKSYYYLTGSTPLEDTYFEVNEVNYQEFQDTILCDGNIEVEAFISYELDTSPGYLRWLIDDMELSSFTDQRHWATQLPVGSHTISMIAKYKYEGPDTLTTSFFISEPKETIINDTICQYNEYKKYNFSVRFLDKPGIFTDHKDLSTILGCDSIVYLNLYVNPVENTTLRDTVCLNEPYNKNGFSIPAQVTPGWLNDDSKLILTTSQGCDSTVRLELYIEADNIVIYDTICMSEPYIKNGFKLETFVTSGDFQFDTIQTTVQGCDRIVHLNLHVIKPASSTTYASVCEGDSYPFYDMDYTASGTYIHYALECNGADTLILTVNPTYETEQYIHIFSGDTYTFNGTDYKRGGRYTNKMTTVHGCDSTFIIHIDETIVPNAFTPNDDGINDIFMPGEDIRVYNRNGFLIYKGNAGWDGTDKGTPLMNDTYFYIMRYTTDGGEKKERKGYVTLIRSAI